MRLDPLLFGMKSFRSKSEWSQHGPTKRRKISPPTTIGIGFDPTGTLDRQGTESLKIDGFAVKAADLTIGLNDEQHQAAILTGERKLHQSTSFMRRLCLSELALLGTSNSYRVHPASSES